MKGVIPKHVDTWCTNSTVTGKGLFTSWSTIVSASSLYFTENEGWFKADCTDNWMCFVNKSFIFIIWQETKKG